MKLPPIVRNSAPSGNNIMEMKETIKKEYFDQKKFFADIVKKIDKSEKDKEDLMKEMKKSDQ